MDERSLDFVRGLIAGHIDNALRGQPTSHSGRGGRLFDLHRRVIEQARATIAEVDAELSVSNDERTQHYARQQLHHTLANVESLLPFLRPLMESVRRADVPIGLLVALDAAIEALLPAGADPVVHFDDAHMYSTLDLCEALSLSPESHSTPIAFLLPVLSPFNALMTPLLVHEIGHTAIFQADLREAATSAASEALNTLLEQYVPDPKAEAHFKARTQLAGWVDELLCDGMATAICGPSYLFAAASFLPATAPDDPTSSHPFPSDRLRFSLRSLESTGWNDFMSETCPGPSSGSDSTQVPTSQDQYKSASCAKYPKH